MLKHEVAESVWATIARLRVDALDGLAPRFRAAVEAGLAACDGAVVRVPLAGGVAVVPLDVRVHETIRTDELQAIYYAQGTTRARTAKGSWHHYGLAVDVVSTAYGWFSGALAQAEWPSRGERDQVAWAWFDAVAARFEARGCKWGGRWHTADLPHVYWGRCKDSPSILSRTAYAAGGAPAVWRLVGAV